GAVRLRFTRRYRDCARVGQRTPGGHASYAEPACCRLRQGNGDHILERSKGCKIKGATAELFGPLSRWKFCTTSKGSNRAVGQRGECDTGRGAARRTGQVGRGHTRTDSTGHH